MTQHRTRAKSSYTVLCVGLLLCATLVAAAQDQPRAPRIIPGIIVIGEGSFTCKEGIAEQRTSEKTARGIELYRKGDLNGAIKELQKPHKLDWSAWIYLSLALYRTGDLMGAAQAFEHSQSAEPVPPCFETHAGDWLARQAAEQTLATNPKDAEAHYVMGMVKLSTHNPADAQVEAELALQAAPDFFLARLLQSEVLMFTKKEEKPASAQGETSCFSNYKAAADALEAAMKRLPAAPDTVGSQERLKALRFYAGFADQPESGRSVFCSSAQNWPRIFYRERAKYTEEARQNKVSGRVKLLALFGADGIVYHPLPIRTLPGGLTESAMRAASKIKFTPATIEGRPVSIVAELDYTFQIF